MNQTVKEILIAGTVVIGSLGLAKITLADTTLVECDVDSSYTVIIPQRVELNADSVTTMSIKTSNRNLEPGDSKEISITSGLEASGEIKLERVGSPTDSLTSTIRTNGEPVVLSNPVVGEFSGYAIAETEVSEIEFGIPQGTKLAGGYSTTLVFTISSK